MSPNVKVVQPSGLLDGINASLFREEINECIANNAEIIIVDFQNVTFMDSSGLGALVKSLETVKTAGGRIFLCSMNEQIQMMFELTSMDRVFQIFSNREELEKHLL